VIALEPGSNIQSLVGTFFHKVSKGMCVQRQLTRRRPTQRVPFSILLLKIFHESD
jgi:hypothetical protein